MVRLIYIISSFSCVFLLFFIKKDKGLKILINQLSSYIDLQTTHFFEAFFIQIEFCFFWSFFFFIPFLIFHIWQFFIPALYNFERKILTQICFYFTIPSFLSFLIGFFYLPSLVCSLSHFLAWSDNAPFLIQISLTDFIQTFCFFQFLFIFYIAALIVLHNSYFFTNFNLHKIRFWVFFLFIVLAAIVSPSDLLSQLLITFFFHFHYEIFILYYFILKQKYDFMKLKKENLPLQESKQV